MTCPTVFILTSSFPYGDGEQFLETELVAWAESGMSVVIVPEKTEGYPARALPQNIELDSTLADRWDSHLWQFRAAISALFSPLLWHELATLIRTKRLSIYRANHAFRSVAQVKLILASLKTIMKHRGNPQSIYAYWLSVSTAAAAVLRRRNVVPHVFARAHGTDLYENIRPASYNALIAQIHKDIDWVYPISSQGGQYLPHYGFKPNQIMVSRLGVDIPTWCVDPTDHRHFTVVSVASATPLKRLQLTIDVLVEMATSNPDLSFEWIWFGDGPLFERILKYAHSRLDNLSNLTFSVKGHCSHDQLLDWYANHQVDLILNTSKSEGIPVSLMEAMAVGIPAYAPRIGGIPELVTEDALFEPDLPARIIASQLSDWIVKAKEPTARMLAREHICKYFDSNSNYQNFVKRVGKTLK